MVQWASMQNRTVNSSVSLARLILTPRRLVVLVAVALVTLLFLLIWGGGEAVIAALQAADLRWMVPAVLFHYSAFAMRGLRWQQLLRRLGHHLSWRYTSTLLLSGWFVSALLPARAGDLLRVGLLRMEERGHPPVPVADSLSSIVLERTLDLLALVGLGASVGFALLRSQLPGWITLAYAVGVTGLLVLGGALLVAPTMLQWLSRWFDYPLWQKLIAFATEVVMALRTLVSQPTLAIILLLESIYIWFCDALLLWFVLRAMAVEAPLASITFVALTVDIFAAIPITPGGLGQVEAVNGALLALLPLPPFNIAVAVLLSRTVSYWSFLAFSGAVTFGAGIGQLLTKQQRHNRIVDE